MAEIKVLNEVGATVVINGEERESLVEDYGSTVMWSVSKEGYVSQEGSQEVYEDTVLPVVLKRETYEITFVVSPSGSTLTVGLADDSGLHEQEYHTVEDGEEVNIVAKWGDEISWSCSKSGYVPQSDNFTVTGDKTVNVTLEEEVVNPDRVITFIVSPTHSKLVINGTTFQQDADTGVLEYIAHDGDVLEWEVSYNGYVTKSGTHTVDGDATIEVILEEEDSITLDSLSLSFGSTANIADIKVISSGAWTASSDSSWLTVTPTSGTAGTTDVTVQASRNSDTTNRIGTLTFSCGTATATLRVTQSAVSSGGTTPDPGETTPTGTLTFSTNSFNTGGSTFTVTPESSDGSDQRLSIKEAYGTAFSNGEYLRLILAGSTFTFNGENETYVKTVVSGVALEGYFEYYAGSSGDGINNGGTIKIVFTYLDENYTISVHILNTYSLNDNADADDSTSEGVNPDADISVGN